MNFKIGDRVNLCWHDGYLKKDIVVEEILEEDNLVYIEGERFGFDKDSGKQITFDESYYIEHV